MTSDRQRVQVVLRVALVLVVVAWLFSDTVRAWIPFWVPLVVLAAFELEFVLQARRDRREAGSSVRAGRVGPGAEDADLGWGEIVEDDDGARWIPPPPRPARGPARHVVAATAVGAAVVLIVAGVRQDASRTWSSLPAPARAATEARITREAARIAGRPVQVRCDDGYAFTGARSDALGIAFPRRGLAYLLPSICRALHDVVAGDDEGSDASAEALVVLAHEAVHLRGERREGVTECLALQEGVALGRRLGLAEDTSRRLMRARYDAALAERSVIRIEYQLPRSCTDGGALDIAPGSGAFP